MKLFSRNFRSLAAAAALGAVIAIAGPAGAARSIDLTPDQSAKVKEVADYIQGFRTIQGEFTQVSSKGNVSKGVFILSKPGKMRFEYAAIDATICTELVAVNNQILHRFKSAEWHIEM